MEEWREVPEYEGLYEVSNLGRVRSVARTNYYHGRNLQSVMLKTFLNRAGGRQSPRITVTLCKGGKMRKFLVHRLVAMAFIPNPKNLPEVAHIDHDATNNVASNLKWCTHKQNITDSVEVGRWARRVTDEDVRAIRARGAAGESQVRIAKDFGLAYGTVNNIINLRSWRHIA